MNEWLKNVSVLLGYIVAIGTSLGIIYKWVAKPLQDIKSENKAQSAKLDRLDADTADLLCSQLTREHDYYINVGWCSPADKQRLDNIYSRYKARGRNHIAESYMRDICSLPEHPKKEMNNDD